MRISTREVLDRLQRPPRLRKRDILLTVGPLVYWMVALQLRPVVIRTYCQNAPAQCTSEQVLAIDRPGLGLENGPADGYSYLTQNTSGVLAVVVPALWNASLALGGTVAPGAAIAATGVDIIVALQTAAWNGAFTETARLVAQRPRPFVYSDHSRAPDPQNYTSFYSGHTSFSAAATSSMVLTLLARGAPPWVLLLAGIAAQCLIISTAVFRMLSGRHFLTDVLIAAVMGGLVAMVVAYKHRTGSGRPPS